MKTEISNKYTSIPDVKEAGAIIRSCVHCGFCNATCPTYQVLHNECDGPRGRIYMIKQFLEGNDVTELTRVHLDRCLTCRSCETTCPSGVKYGRLLDIGRNLLNQKIPRSIFTKLKYWLICRVLTTPMVFSALLSFGRLVKPLLPTEIKRKIPPRQTYKKAPVSSFVRKMVLLESCGQSSATPNTNAAATRVLSALGIQLKPVTQARCCGAIDYHLGAHDKALQFIKYNIEAWWPEVEKNCEAIIVTASGCGPMVQDYGQLLRDDPIYAVKAEYISSLVKDLSEIVADEDLAGLNPDANSDRIALHIPCTLQHGMGLPGTVKTIFYEAGFVLAKTEESHLCCGSAGTYSLLQPELSERLLNRKLRALTGNTPAKIATANIGCQLHLQTKSKVPVFHWIELLDQAINR